jgi:Protein of unknown function (DUF4232)
MNSSARTPGRAALAAAALICLAALATGCASVSAPGAASGSPAAGGAPAASPGAVTLPGSSPTPTAAGGAPSAAATGAQGGGTAGCATRDLGVKLGVSQGTAGSVYQTIVFTNLSNATCTLYGYPGVSLAAGNPVTQIGLAAQRTTGTAVGVITLAPGKSGNALLQIVDADNFPSGTCQPVEASYLQVYPPNQTTPTYVAESAKACAKPVQILMIGPMLAGAGSGS